MKVEGFEKELDYLLSFFPNTPACPTFPREVMTSKTGGQITVRSREELLYELERAHLLDCFIRSHTHEEAKKGIIYLLFIDIDLEGRLDEARRGAVETSARIEEMFNTRPHVQFSGAKGYHVILPLEPVRLESSSAARTALKMVQMYLSNNLCDPHVAGDLVRIFRIPGTINSKGLENEYKGRVMTVQRWDGRRADFSKAKAIPKDIIRRAHAELKEKEKGKVEYSGPLRYYVRKIMEYGEAVRWLPHRSRHIVVCEMIAHGRSDEEIHSFFRLMDDYAEERTQYQIEHARKMGYRYSDAAVEEEYGRLVGIEQGSRTGRYPHLIRCESI
ncbi:MAG: hypothetical protein ACP5KV_05660 [Candidatus Methanomethylicaceae archaeon]